MNATTAAYCASCGARVTPDDRFCASCGEGISFASPPAAEEFASPPEAEPAARGGGYFAVRGLFALAGAQCVVWAPALSWSWVRSAGVEGGRLDQSGLALDNMNALLMILGGFLTLMALATWLTRAHISTSLRRRRQRGDRWGLFTFAIVAGVQSGVIASDASQWQERARTIFSQLGTEATIGWGPGPAVAAVGVVLLLAIGVMEVAVLPPGPKKS